MYGHLIGSLTAEDKAVYILVFSDIKYRQNIASLVVINSWFFGCKNILTEVCRVDVFKNCSVDGLKSLNSIISKTPLWKSMYLITSLSHVLTKPKSTMFFLNFFKGFLFLLRLTDTLVSWYLIQLCRKTKQRKFVYLGFMKTCDEHVIS